MADERNDTPRRPHYFANCLAAVSTVAGVTVAGAIACFSVCTMTQNVLPHSNSLFPEGGAVAGLAAGVVVMVLLYFLFWPRSRRMGDPRPKKERDED